MELSEKKKVSKILSRISLILLGVLIIEFISTHSKWINFSIWIWSEYIFIYSLLILIPLVLLLSSISLRFNIRNKVSWIVFIIAIISIIIIWHFINNVH